MTKVKNILIRIKEYLVPNKLLSLLILLILSVFTGKCSAESIEVVNAANEYRTKILWERYYRAAPEFKYRAKNGVYYRAAFDEAERYFGLHKHEAALSNKLLRSDLISLCNTISADPYIYGSYPTREPADLSIRKRIWKLYENTLNPRDQTIQEAKRSYENCLSKYKQVTKTRS